MRALLDRRSGRRADEDLANVASFHLSSDEYAPVVAYFAVGTKS